MFAAASAAFPATVYGDQTADFIIKGALTDTFPTASDVLVIGDPVPSGIQYTKAGNIGNLKIEHVHTGCGTDAVLAASSTEATAFPWTVAATDGCAGSNIDIGAAKTHQFRLTGLTHEGNANLEVIELTPQFQMRWKNFSYSARIYTK